MDKATVATNMAMIATNSAVLIRNSLPIEKYKLNASLDYNNIINLGDVAHLAEVQIIYVFVAVVVDGF